MNKRQKKKHQPPSLQEAWAVVADALRKDGCFCYFAERDMKQRWRLHAVSPERTVVEEPGFHKIR